MKQIIKMGIEKIIFQHRGIEHEDERRALATAFNGDFEGFTAKQIKTYRVHRTSQLGGKSGHYHKYRGLFHVIRGQITCYAIDIETKASAEYILRDNDSLLIPAFVAHKFIVEGKTIFIGCSEEPYISPELNDNSYGF